MKHSQNDVSTCAHSIHAPSLTRYTLNTTVSSDQLKAVVKKRKAEEEADEFGLGSDEDAGLFKSKKKQSRAAAKPRAPSKPKAAPKPTEKQRQQEKENTRNASGDAAMARALEGMGSDDRRYEENEETRERRNEITSSSSTNRDRELYAKRAAMGDLARQGVTGDQNYNQSSNTSLGKMWSAFTP